MALASQKAGVKAPIPVFKRTILNSFCFKDMI